MYIVGHNDDISGKSSRRLSRFFQSSPDITNSVPFTKDEALMDGIANRLNPNEFGHFKLANHSHTRWYGRSVTISFVLSGGGFCC